MTQNSIDQRFQKKPISIAAEAAMTHDVFVRRFEPRRGDMLIMPPVPLQEAFEFPRGSVYHYVSFDPLIKGPSENDPHLAKVTKRISVEHVREYTSFEGKPVRTAVEVQSQIDNWHRLQKRFRKSRDTLTETIGEDVPAIFNYGMLPILYRYMVSTQIHYYRWVNMWRTVCSTVDKAKDNPRHHFVFLSLPQRMIGMSRIRQAMDMPSSTFVKQIDDPDQWMVIELFKWLDRSRRHETMFSLISPEQLMKLNLVFEDAGRFICLNLGKMDSWLEVPNEKAPAGDRRFPQRAMERNFLGALISLTNMRGGAEVALNEDGELAASGEPGARDVQINDALTQEERLAEAQKDLDKDLEFMERMDQKTPAADVSIGATGVEIIEGVGAIDLHSDNAGVEDILMSKLDSMAIGGELTYAEHRKLVTAVGKSMNLRSPYDPNTTAHEYAEVPLESTTIKDVPRLRDDNIIIDKSLLKNSLGKMDSDYIRNVLPKDKVGAILAIQKAGYIVTNIEAKEEEDILGKFEATTIGIQPIRGKATTIIVKQAVIDEDARIRTGNTEYSYRTNVCDNPIRKVSSSQVALSSYYGKTFVNRSERAVNNYGTWLGRVVDAGVSIDPPLITNAYTENVFRQSAKTPRAYSALSKIYRTFVCQGVTFQFDYDKRAQHFDAERLKYLEDLGFTVVGSKGDKYYALDSNNTLYECPPGDAIPLSPFEEFLGGDVLKAPEEFAECRIKGKDIPAGLVLGSYVGLTALMRDLKVTPRQVVTGQRLNLQPGEWPMAFDDVTYIFNRSDQLATMILAGLAKEAATLRRFPVKHFDSPQVYFAVLESMGMGVRHSQEIEMMGDLFVDNITKRKLIRMGEPTRYAGLVKRACEMLLTDSHSRLKDQAEMRYRRAERLAGNLYTELVNAIREHKRLGNRGTGKLEMSPYAVWHSTMKDGAMIQVKDINPIHAIKEVCAVTSGGNGGRPGRSFTRENRGFDKTEMYIGSEHTVDSKDVGINTSFTASPRFADLEGSPRLEQTEDKSIGELLSITALVSPFIMNDDMKRANFASIQASHAVACDSYIPSLVQTGAESTIGERVNESFSGTARGKGVVKAVNPNGVIVQYNDGTTEGFTIGRRQGKAAGQIIPHDLVTDLKVGDTVQAGDTVTYHKGFFKRDRFNPKRYHWMNGTVCTVAFLESRKTHEDACSISDEFSKSLSSEFSIEKHITVRFDQKVHNLLKVGATVKHGDALCILEDDIASKAGVFSEESLNTLKALSGQAPVAKVSGVIDQIVVYYNGDIQDMSESLQAITSESDKRLRSKLRDAGKNVYTGSVPDGYRIEGEPLLPDTVDIVISISHRVGAGVGDKGVLGLQLKTEISEVYKYPVTTEAGRPIDLIFGGHGVYNRIVGSAPKTGTTNTVIKLLSKKAGQLFMGTYQ